MDALEKELSDIFQMKPMAHWLELLVDEHELPVDPVNTVGNALDNEQVNARGGSPKLNILQWARFQ